jgi:hypothetical protein
MTAHKTFAKTMQHLEGNWKEVCETLDEQEEALVETYVEFLRRIAQACLEKGWRVWFRPNHWTHWGEGGFGNLSILLPKDEFEPQADLPRGCYALLSRDRISWEGAKESLSQRRE